MNPSRFFADSNMSSSVATVSALSTIDLGEVAAAHQDVQQIDFEIQQLEQMASGINNLEQCATDSLADGGLTASAYAIVKSQASHIMAVTGHNPVNVNVQNFEGGLADRATATNVTMLSLKSAAIDIWKAIVKAITEAMEKVRAWFAKMTNAVPGLIKKFEELRKKANDTTTGLKDDSDIKLSASNVQSLADNKNAKITRDQVKNVCATLMTNKADIKSVSKIIEEANKEAGTAIGDIKADSVKDVYATVQTVSTFIKGYIDDLLKLGENPQGTEAKDLGLGDKSKIIKLGVGNQGIVFNIKQEFPSALPDVKDAENVSPEEKTALAAHVTALQAVAPAQLSVRTVVDKPDDADEFEFAALNAGEISKLCDDAIELLTDFKKWKEDQVKIDKQRGVAIKKVADYAKKADKIKGPEGEEALTRHVNDAAKAASSIVRQTGSLLPGYVGLAVKTANIILSVGQSSLSAHK